MSKEPGPTNEEAMEIAIAAAFQYLQGINDHAQGQRWTRVEAYALRLEKAAHAIVGLTGLLRLSQRQDPPTPTPGRRNDPRA